MKGYNKNNSKPKNNKKMFRITAKQRTKRKYFNSIVYPGNCVVTSVDSSRFVTWKMFSEAVAQWQQQTESITLQVKICFNNVQFALIILSRKKKKEKKPTKVKLTSMDGPEMGKRVTFCRLQSASTTEATTGRLRVALPWGLGVPQRSLASTSGGRFRSDRLPQVIVSGADRLDGMEAGMCCGRCC